MLSERDLWAALGTIQPTAAQGPFSRCVAYHNLVPKAPTEESPGRGRAPQPLWGMGSKSFGGRFTPRGSFETIYLAEDATTAFIEVGAIIKRGQSLVTLRTHPWVLITVEGNLPSVLDLTDASVVSQLGSHYQELTGVWRYRQEQTGEAPTQLLGRICYASGLFDGIRFPSSKNSPEGVCVAVFLDRLKPPAFLEVYDPSGNLAQRLP
jgi:RES domain-containing protein